MAYGHRIFTVLGEMLGKVLQFIPQLLWSLMLNTRASLEATFHGNLIQAVITSPLLLSPSAGVEALILPGGEE